VLTERIARIDWPGVESSLDASGFAPILPLLSVEECFGLASLYPNDGLFRSRIDMTRFRFGVGEYKYFANPLPPTVVSLRSAFYSRLAPVANRWMSALGARRRFPDTLDGFLAACHPELLTGHHY